VCVPIAQHVVRAQNVVTRGNAFELRNYYPCCIASMDSAIVCFSAFSISKGMQYDRRLRRAELQRKVTILGEAVVD
jgi:hypothetical protein